MRESRQRSTRVRSRSAVTVIQTGMGSKGSQGSHVLSSVRMKRDIPSTGPRGVLSFFHSLRDGRSRKRLNRNAALVTGGCAFAIFAARFA